MSAAVVKVGQTYRKKDPPRSGRTKPENRGVRSIVRVVKIADNFASVRLISGPVLCATRLHVDFLVSAFDLVEDGTQIVTDADPQLDGSTIRIGDLYRRIKPTTKGRHAGQHATVRVTSLREGLVRYVTIGYPKLLNNFAPEDVFVREFEKIGDADASET